MTIRTRFAPSPTGYLHIGSARTALFNYLFAKHHDGKFLLRIEDTDFDRSTKEAKEAILTSLEWLDIKHDEEIVYQSERADRHREVGHKLIELGKAYYCFSSQDEIAEMREKALANKEHFIFHSPWRDKNPDEYPVGIRPVIRIKAPRQGETIVDDLLQGHVIVQNSHLDDMVLIRSDGMPTYMLAVVVDDHDMKITHIIRGDDHLNNASRQQLIYEAMGWAVPKMVHIPLIHGSDGAKLSKRHGALGVEQYKDMGYLPSALKNYLLRLGWSHGDDEIISEEQAIKWFGIKGMGKSPSRLDFAKMRHMNAHYLRSMKNEELLAIIFKNLDLNLSEISKNNIKHGLEAMKPRAELVGDLVDLADIFIVDSKLKYTDEAKTLIDECNPSIISKVIIAINQINEFNRDNIQAILKELAIENQMKLGDLMKYIRAFITGRPASPSVFEVMEIIGKDISIKRLTG
jgi:glutamyl-tRNA synthetase